jgi:acetylornithine/succinyldiaminopimelate/putrescine aminotransferase
VVRGEFYWIPCHITRTSAEKGNHLISELQKFVAQYPPIYEKITGKGLLMGMHFNSPAIRYRVAEGDDYVLPVEHVSLQCVFNFSPPYSE